MKQVTIFDYIKDILFQKKKKYSLLSEEILDFSPFMLQRWCSMSDKDTTLLLNETSNKWLRINSNKQQYYRLLVTIVPQQKPKKVAYIKKGNKSILSEYDFKSVSETEELSIREIKQSVILLKNLFI